jgi:hypothetical protein
MVTTTAPPRSTSPAASRRPRFFDRPGRNILLAAASLAMIALVALFVTASPGSAAVSFSLRSYSIPGHNTVVYGKVTNSSHHAVGSAQVTVYRVVHGDTRILRQVRTKPDGLYRVALHRRHGSVLHVRVSMLLHGTHYQGSTKFMIRRGRAYAVSAQLLHRGSVFFMPVFNY